MLAPWMDLMMDKRAEVCSFLKLCSLQKITVCTYNSSRTPLFGSGRSTPRTLPKTLAQKRSVTYLMPVLCFWIRINRQMCLWQKPLQIRNGLNFVDLLHVVVAHICPENTQEMYSGLNITYSDVRCGINKLAIKMNINGIVDTALTISSL